MNEIHPTLSEVPPSIFLLQLSSKLPLTSEHCQIRNHSISSNDARFSRVQLLHLLISPIHGLHLSHFSPGTFIVVLATINFEPQKRGTCFVPVSSEGWEGL